LILISLACKSQSTNGGTNHLANESSPYLLQHANNPVDWHPWNKVALDKAKEQNKLLLISIGYASCHWCHVMEHESFEDTTVAKIMNQGFLNIKVDREERPDVDDVYMSACHLATGESCGWPLNAIALPDGRPIWAGTYFPKKRWLEILNYFIDLREKEPEKLEEYAKSLSGEIQKMDQLPIPGDASTFTLETLDRTNQKFLSTIDLKFGGRKGAPKFPMPNNYAYLLEQAHQLGIETDIGKKALSAVTTTLDNIAMGGIYDHLEGGFARYSTDDKWRVPHFEKMLYDNAQLVSLYSKAYQVTKNPLYRNVVEETLAFVESNWRDKSGAYFSSYDADSEGEEGTFYVWTEKEIDEALKDKQLAKTFKKVFNIVNRGNWESNKNILYQTEGLSNLAEQLNIEESALQADIQKAKSILLDLRKKRESPGLDDKVLTSWNALLLSAFTDAYRSLGDQLYLDRANDIANFILEKQRVKDYQLNRNFKDGKSSINAFLDDYALTAQAFIDLYEVTFDETWLNHAKGFVTYTLEHFLDQESGLFFYTSDLDPPLIARKKVLADNVIPSSNSVMARVLFELGTYLYQPEYLEKATLMLSTLLPQIEASPQPSFYSNWLQLYQDLAQPPYEVAIVGTKYKELHQELLKKYLPNALLLGGANEGSLELLKDKLQGDRTLIYVCQNKVCKFPVEEVEKALSLLE
jgi:uncharacterized protein YyaL (SSP411 family)